MSFGFTGMVTSFADSSKCLFDACSYLQNQTIFRLSTSIIWRSSQSIDIVLISIFELFFNRILHVNPKNSMQISITFRFKSKTNRYFSFSPFNVRNTPCHKIFCFSLFSQTINKKNIFMKNEKEKRRKTSIYISVIST